MSIPQTSPVRRAAVAREKQQSAPRRPAPNLASILGTEARARAIDAAETAGAQRLPADHVPAGVLRDLVAARLREAGPGLASWLRTWLRAVGAATVADVPPGLRLQTYAETRLAMSRVGVQ